MLDVSEGYAILYPTLSSSLIIIILHSTVVLVVTPYLGLISLLLALRYKYMFRKPKV
jgi:hypothetical protein